MILTCFLALLTRWIWVTFSPSLIISLSKDHELIPIRIETLAFLQASTTC